MFIEKHGNGLYTAKAAKLTESSNGSLITAASGNTNTLNTRLTQLNSNYNTVSNSYNTVNSNYNSVLSLYNSVDTLSKSNVVYVVNVDANFSSSALDVYTVITGAQVQITKKAGTRLLLKYCVNYWKSGDNSIGFLSSIPVFISNPGTPNTGSWTYDNESYFYFASANQNQNFSGSYAFSSKATSGDITVKLGLRNWYSGYTARISAYSMLLMEVPSA